ncbi:transaldolase [Helicobacter sp.]|uniref:transaldolase n=1 Tax=Helicobacter sp. TaxID=218 RepID=UPI0025B97460|nr:transaldolase [Helicobacter sp.]
MKNSVKDFSLWCDFIERGFLQHNFATHLQEAHFVGATSNPSIFANAILHSNAYKAQLEQLQSAPNLLPKDIYESLAIEDIKLAAQALLGLYEADRDYGYISIEIDPTLSDDAKASIEEGRRLYESIGYENVMIKVPATQAGYEVMGTLFKDGINVNATLVFSEKQAAQCARILDKNSKTNARAVISIFVSRFDSHIPPAEPLQPRLGILNAMVCYGAINELGNSRIRPLFASTGAKIQGLNPDYYITNLIAPHSVNTAPLATIEAFLQSPKERVIPWLDKKEALRAISELDLGKHSLEFLQSTLLAEGLEAFKQSFSAMLASLA